MSGEIKIVEGDNGKAAAGKHVSASEKVEADLLKSGDDAQVRHAKAFIGSSASRVGMETRTFLITPALAQWILDNHLRPKAQRLLNDNTVEEYARAMNAGKWLCTADGISFNTNGELENGQHRMRAVVKSGRAVEFRVTVGATTKFDNGLYGIDVIDRPLERTVAQQIRMRHGADHAAQRSAAMRNVLILAAHRRGWRVGKFSVANYLSVEPLYRAELDCCIENFVPRRGGNNKGVATSPVVGACVFAMKAYPDEVKDFYLKLMTGNGLCDSDPAKTCRHWLMEFSDIDGNSIVIPQKVLNCAMKAVLGQVLRKAYANDSGYEFFLKRQEEVVKETLLRCGFLF